MWETTTLYRVFFPHGLFLGPALALSGAPEWREYMEVKQSARDSDRIGSAI